MPSDPPAKPPPWEELAATSTRDPLVDSTLGEYVVKRRLGAGAMGVVYEGVQKLVDKPVAIKVLQPNAYGHDADNVQKLMAEARAANAVRHRGIVDVYSFGTLPDGRPYLVMELIDGEPLDKVIAREAPLRLDKALAILDELLEALTAAHAVGVIHRDLKPANLFVTGSSDGALHIKVLDFGLAQHSLNIAGGAANTCASAIVGTPHYMPPEQATAKPVGPRTDLYAVGCIAFQMLSGRLPFEAATPVEMMIKHLQAPVPRLSELVQVPAALDELVFRLLAKEPDDRPPSATAVRQELAQLRKAGLPESISTPQLARGFAKTGMRPALREEVPTPLDEEAAGSLQVEKTSVRPPSREEHDTPPSLPAIWQPPSPVERKTAVLPPSRREPLQRSEDTTPVSRRQPPPRAQADQRPAARAPGEEPAPRRIGLAQKIAAAAAGLGLLLGIALAALWPTAAPPVPAEPQDREEPKAVAPPRPGDKPASPGGETPADEGRASPTPLPRPAPELSMVEKLRRKIFARLASMERRYAQKKSANPAVRNFLDSYRARATAATGLQALREIEDDAVDLAKRNDLL
jgi:serine/threonine-protein kinase